MPRKTLSYLKVPVCISLTIILVFFVTLNQGLFNIHPFTVLNNTVVESSAEGSESEKPTTKPTAKPTTNPTAKPTTKATPKPTTTKAPVSQPEPKPQQEVDPSDQTVIVLKLNDPFMTINGAKLEIDPGRGTSPLKPKDRVLIPLTSLVHILGGTVKYEPVRKHIFLTLNENKIQLLVNVRFIIVNGSPKRIDYPPEIINGRTMVPVRFVAENCNIDVKWKDPEVILTANYLPTGMRKAKDFFDNVARTENYAKLPKIFEIFSRIY